MSVYFISEKESNNYDASNKPRMDIESCFKKKGYLELNVFHSSKNKVVALAKGIFTVIRRVKKGDTIFIQYPYYDRKEFIVGFLLRLKKLKKIKIAAVVHDVNSMRYSKDINIYDEMIILNQIDYLILHNQKMTCFLTENGLRSKYVNLQIFDYILDDQIIKNKKNSKQTQLVFAGNLEPNKSGFIYKLIADNNFKTTLNLYGPNFNAEIKNDNIKYLGKYPPEKLIKEVEGKFGLIWDGSSVDLCDGEAGNYTRYNNPFKFSMYIVSELPIICWEEMAIADIVKKYTIGICIKNLNEINDKLNNMNESYYNDMIRNIKGLSEKVRKGYFTLEALNNVEKWIFEKK